MTVRFSMVIENARMHVKKKLPSSPVLRFNQELISIIVNKCRIHGEIREFLRYSSNSIKSDDELRLEIRDFSKFGKKTTRRTQNKKSLDLDQYSQRNQGAKSREKNR